MHSKRRTRGWLAIVAVTASIALAACGDDAGEIGGAGGAAGAGGAGGSMMQPPAFQTVEVFLQSWEINDAGLNVELAGDLELQIGTLLAYPVREDENAPPIIETTVDVVQKGDASRGDTIWAINRSLATYDEYCDDPDPQIVISLLEIDEGFDRSGVAVRGALGGVAVGVGIAFPVAGAVFGSLLVLEGLFAKNDDVGQGDFVIEDGQNRFMLSGKDTRSYVRISKNIISGSCDG